MHLTRFRFNTHRPGARRLLSSPQALHAAVMGGFPDLLPGTSSPGDPLAGIAGSSEAGGSGGEGDRPRVLWRVDHNAKAEVLLYVVSPGRPELTHMVEQAGWPHAEEGPGWRTLDYSGFLSRLEAGQTWAFRLTANPVHSIRRKDGEDTKPTAHVTPRHQAGWLLKKQERCGFEVRRTRKSDPALPEMDGYELLVHDRNSAGFDKPDPRPERKGKRMRVPVVTATFDGRLTVTDPDLLRQALSAGIGRAKAYGCGLMTLAPVGER
ncbi:type I-E CRISPR-associated protein Cas6/Cse3/CasE [Nocardiopsis sp. L17-MgMaSL7]|uniref:type I-E CRISPR-associated protein Cas6/Cse3/CasE n=1 Tax=Nocardiopsis sp. L17-MgMaSL7 TaxID=1938893 RepID=UPI000D70F655|nr:type I-E CRISPR-associated protein Cas6/Cse3/CasE [Nocardiopsis sp. L17-MgMaSL7]PWV54736.1 CRISPR system Cascade subunit CasE [Nocardiopsis sp. L17-MgMaSL7]